MIVVDATKDLLMNVLPYHPFLIKPNNHELGEIFGVELKTRQEVVPYGKKTSGTWRGKCTDIHGRRRGCTDYKARCGLQKEAPEGKLVTALVQGILWWQDLWQDGLKTGL